MKYLFTLVLAVTLQSNAYEYFTNQFDAIPNTAGRLTIGDVNGDGYNDIVSNGIISFNITGFCVTGFCQGRYYEDPARIWINNQSGGFSEIPQQVEFRTIAEQYEGIYFAEYNEVPYTAIVDMDNDGDNDLASSSGVVFLNDGTGVFSEPLDVGYVFSNSPIYSVDLNNDGVYELIADQKIYIRVSTEPLKYMNINETILLNPQFYDINNDGFKDAITFGDDRFINVWVNDQSGNFPENLVITLSEKESYNLVIGDVDGDSDFDIILSGYRMLKNNGNLEFVLEDLISNNNSAGSEVVAPRKLVDFNSDGSLDLFMTVQFEEGNNEFYNYIFINNGFGVYEIPDQNQDEQILKELGNTFNLLDDFNSDGIIDVISSDSLVLDNDELLGANFDELSMNDIIHQITSGFDLTILLNESNGDMYPSSGVVINRNSNFYLFDENLDGNKVLLFYNYNYTINNDYSLEINDSPYIYSELKLNTEKIDKFNLDFLSDYEFIEYIMPLNLNDDNKDDLYIDYLSCENSCERKREVWINSELGFSDPVDIDFDLKNYKIADLNGDGFNDFIKRSRDNDSSNSIKIQESIEGLEFIEKSIDIPEYDSFIKAVSDVNNDSFADIFFMDLNFDLYVVFGNPDFSKLSAQFIGKYRVNKIEFYDSNNNGNQDIFIIESDSNDILKFEYSSNDIIFKSRSLTQIRGQISQVELVDMDGDNIMDIVASSDNQLKIYQRDEFGKYLSIFDEPIASNFGKFIIHDFDNDLKLDIATNKKVLFGRNFPFQTGLNYDRNHSGHGFSIENVGNDQFFSVFYTYGNDRYPEWYTDLGVFETPREDYWNISSIGSGLIRSEYDYTNNTFTQLNNNDSKGIIENSKCSDTYGDINLNFEIGINGFGLPVSRGDWCSQPIVGYYQRPVENDLSGLWWAGSDDSGWGWSVSLVEREEATDIVVVLYNYDGQGNPRWLIGQQSGFQAGVELTLDMNMVKGYPRWADPKPLVLESAGTMSLTLNQASRDLNLAGSLSVDVNYPGPEGGSWVRNNIPIALFSVPRNK